MAKGPIKTAVFNTPKGAKRVNVRGTVAQIVKRAPKGTTAFRVYAPVMGKAEVPVTFERTSAPAGQVCMIQRGKSGAKPVCVPATGSGKASKKAKSKRSGAAETKRLARLARQVQRGFDPRLAFSGITVRT